MLKRFSPPESIERKEVESAFDVREALGFVWRQWKFIASVLGVTLVIATVYVLKQTPLYTAIAQVLLEPQREKTAGKETVLSEPTLDFATIENQLAIIRSTVFLRRVVEKERLVSDPEFGSGPRATEASPQEPQNLQENPSLLSKLRGFFMGPAKESTPVKTPPKEGATPADIMASIDALKGAVLVARQGQGYILSLSVTSVDPDKAARLVNAVAEAYVVEKLDARFEATKRASAWLSDRLVDLRKQLRESEEAVAQFRSENGLLQSGSNVTLGQQQLSELNAKLVTAKSEMAEKKARVDLLRSIEEKGGNIQSLPDLPNAGALATLRTQEAALSQKEADLVARYNDRHPLVVNLRAERRDVQRAILAETQRMSASTKNEYELAKARAEAVERTFREVTGQSGADDRTAITLRELERTAAVNKSLFEDFLQRAKITQEQSTFEAREARVITPALSGAQSYPRKSRTLGIALFIGLVLGIGGAVAKEKLNAGFTTPHQVEGILELPVLASVPSMSKSDRTIDGKVIPLPNYAKAMPLSRFGEALRALRSGIRMTDVDDPPKVVQVTSTVPGEGKTTLALSMAASAAISGQRVLLIDADLRHPSASGFFSGSKVGLVDVLLETNLQEVVSFKESLGYWVLSAGSKTQNPSDLLGSARMKALVASAKKSFDLVVIDTPPVGPVIDPIIVSEFVDKVVYVVGWATTSRDLVKRTVGQFPGHKKVAGIVLNLVNEKEAKKYGKHAYGYYYGSESFKKYYEG
jgi:capsular exopolysaccharide synthesis family protein